jgi:hypothetical protein
MAVQVDYRIAPSDQFSVYNPDTKANKTITYFTLLAKIRGDLNISGSTGGGDISGSGSVNYLSKFDGEKSITISQLYDDGTYVGIGNTSPAHKLDVNGGVYADYFQLDTSYSDGAIAGKFSWNPDRETVEPWLRWHCIAYLGSRCTLVRQEPIRRPYTQRKSCTGLWRTGRIITHYRRAYGGRWKRFFKIFIGHHH